MPTLLLSQETILTFIFVTFLLTFSTVETIHKPTLPLWATYDHKSNNEAMRVDGVEWATKIKQ